MISKEKTIKYFKTLLDVLRGIIVFISMVGIGAIFWLFIVLSLTTEPNNSDRHMALHFGSYDTEHRRTGTWEIKSSYLLANNGNEGSSHIAGDYEKGLRIGVWCIKDNHEIYEVQVYNEGILQESLRLNYWNNAISYEHYKEGKMQESFYYCYINRDNNQDCPAKTTLLNLAKHYNTLINQCTKIKMQKAKLP
ncbi:hypothetical protein [Helicobacter burdigaliensis]|uniref:hypothetical protein n=1 Tax=Helicobacter burdigaliensis TaxID=2315334 RepID=UPI000EF687E9|nr:hypothetical protein [Helicobacter burdigaliensis]